MKNNELELAFLKYWCNLTVKKTIYLQNLATIPDSVTSPKFGQVNAVGEIVKAVNNVPAKKKTNDFLTTKMVQEKTSIVNSQVKTVVSPTTKTNAFLTTVVVQEKSSKTNSQVKTVVSPTTNHVTPVQKEENRQEKTVHGFGEKNSVLDNRSKKRKRGTVVEIPSKKRLLEAIPSRSLQPLTNVSITMFTNNNFTIVCCLANTIACSSCNILVRFYLSLSICLSIPATISLEYRERDGVAFGIV